MSEPLNAYLVCGGKWHDIDFARARLLELLLEHEDVRTRVAEDFRDTEALAKADFLVTYTCALDVDEAQEDALQAFVAGGKRWFALHGTNSVLEFLDGGGVRAPHVQQKLMRTLGSQFFAHPPICVFEVKNVAPQHPLVAGIEDFDVEDELYLCEYHGEIQPLLETRFTGKALGFEREEWPDDDPRLVMYLHPEGQGEVLYLTLGHCRGKYDMRPMMDVYPRVERGAWEYPIFAELLRRGLRWAKGESPAPG
jgi:type 1 glutamine amidotransferase